MTKGSVTNDGIDESSDFICILYEQQLKASLEQYFNQELVISKQIQTNHPVNWSNLLLFVSNYLSTWPRIHIVPSSVAQSGNDYFIFNKKQSSS